MVKSGRKAAVPKSRSPSTRNNKLIEKSKTTKSKPAPKKNPISSSDEDSPVEKKAQKTQKAKQQKKKEQILSDEEDSPVEKKAPKTKAKPKKKEVVKKEPAEEKESAKEQTSQGSGYVFFKNPKYGKIAEKLAEASPEEVKKMAEENQFSLQEKIHVGNLLSGIAAKIAQYGVKADKYCYGSKNEEYLNKYQDLIDNYTVVKLKDLLVLNDQPKTATKDILCERVADGFTLGKIPKCPSCLGGR